MDNKNKGELSLPMIGMIMLGLTGAIVTSASFYVINYWPLPVSIAPYYGPGEGFAWGLVAGGICGWVIGFLVDDKHFSDNQG
jgi:ABC-type uncharacterized transport system permease subunit